MKVSYLLLFTLVFFGDLVAQEFMVDVKVQAPSVQTNDRQIFSDLEITASHVSIADETDYVVAFAIIET